jgi:aerobic-type carbon monoxide dehydrogenase small subunit (CoxS/CutS family)
VTPEQVTPMSDSETREPTDISRRAFLEGTSAAIVVAAASPAALAQSPSAVPNAVPTSTIRVTVNGTAHAVEVEDRWTLADLLRDHLTLTGTKLGCERGECGACTVLLDDRPVYACSQLAVWTDGRSVTTVEGLARNGVLHPLQQAFVEHDAPQCGFCTSGQLMSAKALLDRNPHPTSQEVRTALAGNLCRCANYNRYVEAVVAVGAGRTAPLPDPDPRRTGGGQ